MHMHGLGADDVPAQYGNPGEMRPAGSAETSTPS